MSIAMCPQCLRTTHMCVCEARKNHLVACRYRNKIEQGIPVSTDLCTCLGIRADQYETVIIESPYQGTDEEIERNVRYARCAMLDCLRRREAPFASHLLYTQPGVLDDRKPEERTMGITAGIAWRKRATKIAFYIDLGYSDGMMKALRFYEAEGKRMETRTIPGWK